MDGVSNEVSGIGSKQAPKQGAGPQVAEEVQGKNQSNLQNNVERVGEIRQ